MLSRKRTCVGNWLKCIIIVIYILEVQSAAECDNIHNYISRKYLNIISTFPSYLSPLLF